MPLRLSQHIITAVRKWHNDIAKQCFETHQHCDLKDKFTAVSVSSICTALKCTIRSKYLLYLQEFLDMFTLYDNGLIFIFSLKSSAFQIADLLP